MPVITPNTIQYHGDTRVYAAHRAAGGGLVDVISLDFTDMAAGANDFLPRTGWLANDWSDGGHANDGNWETYKDGSTSVLYNANSATHLHYDAGSADHEVEADLKLSNASADRIVGVMVAAHATDVLEYVSVELVQTPGENKVIVYHRDGGTYDEWYSDTSAGLVEETYYNLRLAVVDGVVSAWLDGVLLDAHPLSAPQIAALADHHRAGPINYAGYANFDTVTIRGTP
jgi:hypothetical protein